MRSCKDSITVAIASVSSFSRVAFLCASFSYRADARFMRRAIVRITSVGISKSLLAMSSRNWPKTGLYICMGGALVSMRLALNGPS